MSNKDFQNGFALGSIISGATTKKLLEHTVTFLLNDELYEIVGVKDGGSVDAPFTIPSVDNNNFKGWYDGDTAITFPYTPTADKELVGVFGGLSDVIYNHFGVDKTQYPVLAIRCQGDVKPNTMYELIVCFGKMHEPGYSNDIRISGERLEHTFKRGDSIVLPNQKVETIVDYIVKNITPNLKMVNEDSLSLSPGRVGYCLYTNFDDDYHIWSERYIIY